MLPLRAELRVPPTALNLLCAGLAEEEEDFT